jgi:glucans biosynthesis protein C
MMSLPLSHRHRRDAISEVSEASGRRHELDWLRVLIIVGLIPFHVVGLFIAALDSYVEGRSSSSLVTIVSDFFGLWPMSLLFLVAGASTWFALGRRTTRQYARERLLRLFVPFLFATLVIIPIQVYAVVSAYPELLRLNLVPGIELRGNETFPRFYPPYLAGYAYFLTHFSSMREIVFWGHIWFVPRLLFYALAALPVLLWLRGERGRRFVTRTSRFFVWPGSMLCLGALIMLPRLLAAVFYRLALAMSPATSWDPYNLWAQLGVFLLFFLLGYLIYSSPELLRAVRRDGAVALALGIGTFVLLQTPIGQFASVTQVTPGGIVMICLRAASEWMLVVGVLNIGLHFFLVSNAALDYLNDAAYPLYVLHMPVLILVGLAVVQSGLSNMIALPLVVLTTLALTLGLYEFVIKRTGILRLLFGLKPSHALAGKSAGISMPKLGHHPDDHDDGGVTQPVGKR